MRLRRLTPAAGRTATGVVVFLQRILEGKEEELAGLRRRADELSARARDAPPPRGFVRSLRSTSDVAVIAEFKRRSPSAGALAPDADPARRTSLYQSAGARAISVLTDREHFGGSLDDLQQARAATELPVLRKDFLLDPVQVYEARAAGADAVLLIVRILEDSRLRELLGTVGSTGMDALVEVHDQEELGRAEAAGARCIGVNARDLSSFRVDLARSEELLRRVAGDLVAVAESGIRDGTDVDRMGAAGADAVLVGSALMEGDAGSLLRRLTGRRPEIQTRPREGGRGPGREPETRVKICGLCRREHVREAERAGASFGGLVFADSPRRVEPEDAADLVRGTDLRRVGVFVDPDRDELLRIASLVPLEVVQLHGEESVGLCEEIRDEGLTVWKAIRPRSPEELRERAREYLHAADALMVDGYDPGGVGGTGTSVPLEWAESLRQVLEVESHRRVPLILAGGLTPENVGEAIRRVGPDVVDVSSGVESRPGEKSPELIRAFVSAVRRQPAVRDEPARRE